MKKRKKMQILLGICVLACGIVPLLQSRAADGRKQGERGEKIREIFLTQEEYRALMEEEKKCEKKPVEITDEVCIIHFPKRPTLFNAAARASDLVYSGRVTYHGYNVGMFTIGGKTAFCIQHSKWQPETGTAYRLEPWNNITAKKILYYGYGGKKPWSKFENDVHARVLTSLALSNLVEGRFPSDGYIWGTGKLEEFLNYCKGQTLPDTSIALSKTELQAYVDGTMQRTETVTLKAGDSSNTVEFSVPKNVTLHNVSRNTRVTGGANGTKATIGAGETFYLSAPLSVTGTWDSGVRRGTLQTITTLNRVYCDGNNQDLCCAVFGVEQGKTVSFRVNWLSRGKVKLQKVSKKPEFSAGNSCYSLAGAEFAVYKNYDPTNETVSDEVARLLTDVSGMSNVVELDGGTYYVKELKAPTGYALCTEVKKIEVTAGREHTIEFADVPQYAPITVLLKKVDSMTQQGKPQGSASLSGAEFSVKFYSGLWEEGKKPETLGKTAVRDWVFATDRNGIVEYKEDYRVRGDDLYKDEKGEPAMPLGTVTIQEVKAPEGYLLNDKVFVIRVVPEGSAPSVTIYQPPTISENVLELRLMKKQEGTVVVIEGAEFTHTKPDGTKERAVTGKDGVLKFTGLQHGKHRLEETAVGDGYLLNKAVVEFEVGEDNRVTLFTKHSKEEDGIEFRVTKEGEVEVTVEDKPAPFRLLIHKQNEKGIKLADAVFSLFSERECKNKLQDGVTNASGKLTMSGLEIGKKYYLTETKAPKGYRLPTDKNGKPKVYEIWAESVPAKDRFVFYIDGNSYDASEEGGFVLGGTKAEREVQITIHNTTGKRLPDTGSGLLYPMTLTGLLLGLFSVVRFHKNHKIK